MEIRNAAGEPIVRFGESDITVRRADGSWASLTALPDQIDGRIQNVWTTLDHHRDVKFPAVETGIANVNGRADALWIAVNNVNGRADALWDAHNAQADEIQLLRTTLNVVGGYIQTTLVPRINYLTQRVNALEGGGGPGPINPPAI